LKAKQYIGVLVNSLKSKIMNANKYKIRKNEDKIKKYLISGLSQKEIDFNVQRLNNEIKQLEKVVVLNF
jgi:hypothetical protein